MTADTLCGYPNRDEALVSYLYDELDVTERSAFDTHLVLCARCRVELGDLSGVRTQLSAWQPDAVVSHQPSAISHQASAISHQSSVILHEPSALPESSSDAVFLRGSWWREVPRWAQVAAALLCLGVGAGVANLNVRYDHDGLSIRTGWLRSSEPGAPTAATQSARIIVAPAGADATPWRADLAALERTLRTEFQSATTASPGVTLARSTQPSLSDAELLKRVRALVDESERRQKRELALRVGEMARDVHSQRQADLRKIDQSLEYVLSNTGLAVAKQQQTLNYLVSRTSSQK